MSGYLFDANPLIYVYKAGSYAALTLYARAFPSVIADQVLNEILQAPDVQEVADFTMFAESGLGSGLI